MTQILNLIFKNKVPLVILELIEGRQTVNQVREALDMNKTEVYKYMNQLRECGIVRRTPSQPAYFSLTDYGTIVAEHLHRIVYFVSDVKNDD